MRLPDCSPCGLAVDWSRRCYQSEWHLFADDPETTTAGRYYRCLENTPFIPGYHHYGSREWLESNWQHLQGLGESLTFKSVWNPGDRPKILPINSIVGSLDCIANGGSYDHQVPYDQIFDGFPVKCILPDLLPNGPWAKVSSYDSCSLQYFYTQILMWMYDHDPLSIEVAFKMLIPGCEVFWKLGTALYPDLVCVVTPTFTVLVIDGTQTWQQWAMQGLRGITPPTNYGYYSTLPLWYDASTRALDFMEECGANPTGRFMLVGHSYGGATVYNVAARLRGNNNTIQIVCLTFGSPKPGDTRMIRLIDTTSGMAVVNDQDVVGSVPPDFPSLYPVLIITGMFDLENWDQWQHPTDRARQDANGMLTLNVSPILDAGTLLTMLSQILLNEPFTDILTHPTEVYRNRILKRCPECDWPISAQLCRFLHGIQAKGLLGLFDWQEPDIGLIGLTLPADVNIITGGVNCTFATVVEWDVLYTTTTTGTVSYWFQIPNPCDFGHPTLELLFDARDLDLEWIWAVAGGDCPDGITPIDNVETNGVKTIEIYLSSGTPLWFVLIPGSDNVTVQFKVSFTDPP